VTSRVTAGLPSLRGGAALRALHDCFRASNAEGRVRIVVFSVQPNHIHLLVEADDRQALVRGLKGLHVRIARSLNRIWRRSGACFPERYHARTLSTPLEVRNALVYVLHNARRHGASFRGPDPCSSGPWFDGWSREVAHPTSRDASGPPVVAATSWLVRVGWRRHGLIDPDEAPSVDQARR
jgi:REP element-mobilizing transposase RayT